MSKFGHHMEIVAGTIIEQALLEPISMQIKDKKVMKNSQHGFTKVKSGLSASYIEITGSVNRGRAQCQFTLTLASLLIQSPILILSAKLEKQNLDRRTTGWKGPALSGTSMTSNGVSSHLNYLPNLFFSNSTASPNRYPVFPVHPIKFFSWYLI